MAIRTTIRKTIAPSTEKNPLLQFIESDPRLKKQIEKASKPKVSLLNKLFGVLNWGETATVVNELQKGKSFEEALKTQAGVSAKRITGQGMGNAATYEDVLETAGMKKDAFGTKALGLAGDIFLDVGNYINPFKPAAKLAGKALGFAADVGKKIPVVSDVVKGIEGVGKGVQDLFVPGAKLAREAGPEGTKFFNELGDFQKGTRYAQKVAAEEGLDLAKAGAKTPGFNEKLLQYLEPGEKAVEDVGGVGTTLKGWFKDIAEKEKSRGLLDNEIENYLFHSATKEAKAAGVDYMGALDNALKATKGKSRTIEGTIKEINEMSQKQFGFKMFEEDVLKAATLRKLTSIQKVSTFDFLNKTADEFGKAGKMETQIIDGVKHIPYTLKIPGSRQVLLPEAIAKEIDNVSKTLTNDEAINSFLKTYDKVLAIWKGSVTGWFPAFHGRNILGGVFNNGIAGVTNIGRYVDGDKFARAIDEVIPGVKIAGEPVTYKSLKQLAGKSGVIGDQGYFDIMKSMEQTADAGFKKGISNVGEIPRKAMNIIEERLRGTLLIDRLKKGDAMEDAVKQVFKYHFDYAPEAVTGFEKGVMKRLIPFYTWIRNNIPLQLEQMVKQPAKYAAVGKVERTLQGDTDVSALPEYMKRGVTIKAGEKEGIPQFLYSLGLPVEDVNKLKSNEILSMLSPFIKVPLEIATNKHLFFNKPLDEVNTPPKTFQTNAPKFLKDMVGYNESTKKVDPIKWHLLSSVAGRLLWTSAKMGEPETSFGMKALYGAFGVSAKGVDLKKEEGYRQQEQEDAVSKFLFQKGYMKKYSNYYVPKAK